MRAFIFATGDYPRLAPLSDTMLGCLIPLGDRSLFQHFLELLVEEGVRDVHIMVRDFPEQLELLVGEGMRWGISVTWHLCRDERAAFRRLLIQARIGWSGLSLVCFPDTILWGVVAGQLAVPPAADVVRIFPCCNAQTTTPDENTLIPAWYVLSGTLFGCLENVTTRAELDRLFRSGYAGRVEIIPTPNGLPVSGLDSIMGLQERVLHGDFSGLIFGIPEAEAGLRFGRNVSLHPSVELVPPVLIGSNCHIAERVHLGPNVVLSGNSIVDAGASLANALVLGGTYIGEGLEVRDSIVDRHRLFSIHFGGAIHVVDDFILGNIEDSPMAGWLRELPWRLLALFVFLGALPVSLGIWLGMYIFRYWQRLNHAAANLIQRSPSVRPVGKQPPNEPPDSEYSFFGARAVVRTPTVREGDALEECQVRCLPALGPSKRPLTHFFLEVVPGLPSVIKGDVCLLGLPMRSTADIAKLPKEWRNLHCKTKTGLITESFVAYGWSCSAEEAYLADAYYATHQYFLNDCDLLCRYVFSWLQTYQLQRPQMTTTSLLTAKRPKSSRKPR